MHCSQAQLTLCVVGYELLLLAKAFPSHQIVGADIGTVPKDNTACKYAAKAFVIYIASVLCPSLPSQLRWQEHRSTTADQLK